MPHSFVHYQVTSKNKTWGRAITEGFRAKVARLDRAELGRNHVHIVAGLQFGALNVLTQIWRAGEPYIFVDRAYFGGGSKSGRMRLTFGAYQQHWVKPAEPRDWGVTLEPWRAPGEFVMVVPPSPAIEDLFGFNWAREYAAAIQAAAGMPVLISPKSDRDVSPIAQRLSGCHAVVTWTSNVAVDAICAGIPAFVQRFSAAAPVAGRLDGLRIDRPFRGDRAAWFASLSRGQWTLEEVGAGVARDALMEVECATT